MDNRIDNKIKQELKQELQIPEIVKQKMQEAYKKIEESEDLEMKEENKSKYKLSKVLSLAASFVLIVFLIGNGISYAMGGANIYSWILEKIGISKEYEESKTDINQVVEKNGVKVTLMDMAYDTNFLIMGYMFETEDLCQKSYDLGYYQIDQNVQDKNKIIVNMLQNSAAIEFQAKISDGKNETYIGNYSDSNSGFKLESGDICYLDKIQTFARVISKNELVLYVVADISKYKFDDTANIEIIIDKLGMDMVDAMPPIFEGEWNFTVNNLNKGLTETKDYKLQNAIAEFEIEKEYGWAIDGTTGEKEYYDEPMLVVTEGELGKVTISNIQISKIGTIIKMKTNFENGTMVDESIKVPRYAFDLIDSQGNLLLEKEMVYNNGAFFTQKLNENENYTINIYKYYTNQFNDDRYNKDTEFKFITSMKFNLNNLEFNNDFLGIETDREKTQEITNKFVEALNAKDIKTMQEYGSSDAVATVQKYNMTNMKSPEFSYCIEESNSYYYFAPYEFEYNGITDPQDISLAYFLVLKERDGKFLVTCVGATG